MPRVKIDQQPAYLLHRRPFSESSLLLDVFSRNHGRLTLIAKGCRKKKDQAQGLFIPFNPLLISWTGKGDLPILTSIEHQGFVPSPSSIGIHCGYYINELLLKLLHRHDSHEILFDRYDDFVRRLSVNHDHESSLRIIEKHLLKETGFGLVLDHDVSTGEIIVENGSYIYLPEKGPVASEKTESGSVSGSTLLAMQNETAFSDFEKRQARRLTRTLLNIQLNGKQLRSRRVVREIKRYHKSHRLKE